MIAGHGTESPLHAVCIAGNILLLNGVHAECGEDSWQFRAVVLLEQDRDGLNGSNWYTACLKIAVVVYLVRP
jgi:hypothetical protein